MHTLEALSGLAAAKESYVECAAARGAAQALRDEMGYVLRWPYETQLRHADLAAARVIEGKAGVLQHADEHESAQGLVAKATLSDFAGVGGEQPAAFVVANRRGGDVRAFTSPIVISGSGIFPT